MKSANELAQYLIHLAAREEEPEYLTNLRLQKLLYYVQGWALALRGNPLFADPIEAWRHGPAIRSVYRTYKAYGNNPIPPDQVLRPEGLGKREEAFIDSVWEFYKKYSAIGLMEKTHNERPWQAARKSSAPQDEGHEEISQIAMAEFFKAEFESGEKLPEMDLAAVRRLIREPMSGPGKPFEEILKRFGLQDASPSSPVQ